MPRIAQKNLINLLFALALTILCAVGILSFLQIKRLDRSNNWVTHTYQVIETANSVLANLIDTESKQQGYLLTNNGVHLDTFHHAIDKVNQKLQIVRQLTADNPLQQQRLNNIAPLIKNRLDLLQKIVDVHTNQSNSAAIKIFSLGQGKILTDQIWLQFTEIINEEEKLLQQRNQVASQEAYRINFLITVSNIVSIILLLLSIILFNRYLKYRIHANQVAQELQHRLSGIIESTNDGIVALDLNLRFIVFNSAYTQMFEKLFGVQIHLGMCISDALIDYPKLQTNAAQLWQRALNGEHLTAVHEIQSVDQQDYIYEVTYNPLLNANQQCIGISYIVRDITTRVKAEQQLQESEERFRKAFDNSGVGMALMSLDGHWLKFNKSFCAIIGHNEKQLPKMNLQTLIFPADLATTMLYLQQLQANVISCCQIENRYIQNNGNINWAFTTVSFMRDAQANPLYYIIQIQDINAKKKTEDQLKHIAYHDPLTGLANRANLERSLDQALAAAHRQQRSLAVLFLDLDGFKVINDNYGHDAGDILLQQVAERLKHCTQTTDIIARLGGDEFVIALIDIADDEAMVACANKILQQLLQPFVVQYQELFISTSIGISLYPNDGDNYGSLMKSADLALYAAKERGRNNYQFYKKT